MSTRAQRQEEEYARSDRVFWASWEENHYPQDRTRESVIAERCEEAGYEREED